MRWRPFCPDGTGSMSCPDRTVTAEAVARALACDKPRCGCGRHHGKEWSGHCPAHADDKPSLSISENGNRVLVHCHAGCDQDAVVGALKERGLWPDSSRHDGRRGEIIYTYRDEDGTPLFEVCRFAGKKFRPRLPGASEWGIGDTRRVLYRLPELLAADPHEPVFVVEGEKDADRLASFGLVATTNPLGAGKWREEYAAFLRDRGVFILSDNDDPGREHAQKVAESLKDVASGVKVVELPGLPDKGDVSDWLDAGRTVEQLVALCAGVGSAPDIDGEAVLGELVAYVRRYVIVNDEQADAVALWVTHTHALAAAEVTPYLHVASPEKQSGKTLLLEVLRLLAAKPWKTSRCSVAALVRKAGTEPTLLLDEADKSFERESEFTSALHQILNDGFQRGGTATMCVGPSLEVKEFPVFCPKAIAGIGSLPDTIEDRSIPIAMMRMARHETVDRFRQRDARELAAPVKESAGLWAALHIDELRGARPDLPEELSARAQDVWEPLLAIADLAGGEWPQRARKAAVVLMTRNQDASQGVRLLDDIQTIFTEHGDPDRLTTATLLSDLNEREEWTWGTIDHGRSLNGHRLAALLKPFGVGPTRWREGDVVTRGYHRSDFFDLWARYLPTPGKSVTSVTSVTDASREPVQSSLDEAVVTDVTDVTDFQGVCSHQTSEQVAERWLVAEAQSAEVAVCECCKGPTAHGRVRCLRCPEPDEAPTASADIFEAPTPVAAEGTRL